MADVRGTIVWLAGAAVQQHAKYIYTEGQLRMSAVHNPTANPVYSDCSAFVTYMYSWAGAPDPNGLNYNGQGYTGTLLANGQLLPNAGAAQPGDLVVYGGGTGEHVALITEAGADPLTVSMGEQGDPSFVRVSQDGRQPQRFLRFNTTSGIPTPTATSAGDRVLKLGMTGLDVAWLQGKLKVPVDGNFGPQTDRAVRAFQQWVHLPVDGVVGPQTWAALKG